MRDVARSAIKPPGVIHANRTAECDLSVTIAARRERVVVAEDSRADAEIDAWIEDRMHGHAEAGEVHAVDLRDAGIDRMPSAAEARS